MSPLDVTDERLLTFEAGGELFAMPIAGVLEVAELSGSARIPTVADDVACVMNYRGDALPIVRRHRVLDLSAAPAADAEHVLVVTDRQSAVPRLGLEVDRVLGLVDGRATRSRDASVVAERRPMNGRVACILDPSRVVARARAVIEGALGRSD